MNTRRQTNNVTIDVEISSAKIFLQTLESEISPTSLCKFKKVRELKNELKEDKLFDIWNKYSNIVDDAVSQEIAPRQQMDVLPINENEDSEANEEQTSIVIEFIDQMTDVNNKENFDIHKADMYNNNNTENEKLNTNVNGDTMETEIDSAIQNDENRRMEVVDQERETDIIPVIADSSVQTASSSIDIWNKHLSFPTIEKTTKKRKTQVTPLAVTSAAYKEFYEKKRNEKKALEDAKQQRIIERAIKRQEFLIKKMNKKTKINTKKQKMTFTDSSSDSVISGAPDDSDGGKKIKRKQAKPCSDIRGYESESNSSGELESISLDEPIEKIEKKVDATRGRHSFSVADFVIVIYEKEYFPGVIIQKKNNEYEIRAMHKSGPQHWKWPEKTDQIWYNVSQVVQTIEPPQIACSRGNSYTVLEMKNYS